MVEEVGTDRARQLMKYQGVARLTEKDARDIITTIWPKAPEVEKKKALLICVQYQLNPLMKHLYILGPFKDEDTGEESYAVALSIQCNRLLANRQGRYSYIDDTPRVMTDEEQKKINGRIDTDKLWAITKVRDEHGNTAPGYGFWPKSKLAYGEKKGNTRENMAFIRSERAALDRLFPDVSPPNVEVVDTRFIPETTQTAGTKTRKIVVADVTSNKDNKDKADKKDNQDKSDTTNKTTAVGSPITKTPSEEERGDATDRSKQGGGGQKAAENVSLSQQGGKIENPAERARRRDADKKVLQAAAGKLNWNYQRLMEELKKRTGVDQLDQLTDEQLFEVASKIVDLAENQAR